VAPRISGHRCGPTGPELNSRGSPSAWPRPGLTPTEKRIARLAAEGLTNREIADRIFLSPKTVEVNVTRIYRKLGVRSRALLASRFAVAKDNHQTYGRPDSTLRRPVARLVQLLHDDAGG
jgi:DNA-binding CsgD family transcriptional regulator